jgi:hypothetical protein
MSRNAFATVAAVLNMKVVNGDLFAVNNLGEVHDISAGGDFTAAAPFASGVDVGGSYAGMVHYGCPTDCDDGEACTIDICGAPPNCTHYNTSDACNDGDACTLEDVCSNGSCQGRAIDCDDGDVCTADGCSGGDCSHEPIDDCCLSNADCDPDASCDVPNNQCVPNAASGSGGSANAGAGEKDACGCRVVGASRSGALGGLAWLGLALGVLAALGRRRRQAARG